MEKKRRKWFIAVVILLVLAVAFPVEEAVSQAEAVLEAAAVGVWKYRQVQAEETAAQSTEIVLGENQTLEEVQIKTINGNEMTYERDGETVTTLIPVGTTVTTKLGTTTTFSRLSPGNTIQMGLEERVTHKPNELSGGQKQRVSIARALSAKPAILLADEPTGALDTASGKEVLKLFAQLNEMGNTIVMITHDLKVAQAAKRVVRIEDGCLTEMEG